MIIHKFGGRCMGGGGMRRRRRKAGETKGFTEGIS